MQNPKRAKFETNDTRDTHKPQKKKWKQKPWINLREWRVDYSVHSSMAGATFSDRKTTPSPFNPSRNMWWHVTTGKHSHSVILSFGRKQKKYVFFSVLVICYGVCADWHRAWNFATHCKPLNAKSHQQRQLTGRLWKPMGGQPSPAAMKCVFAGKKRRKTVKVCIAANLFIGKLQSCREMNVVASVQPKEKNIFAALLSSATTHK